MDPNEQRGLVAQHAKSAVMFKESGDLRRALDIVLRRRNLCYRLHLQESMMVNSGFEGVLYDELGQKDHARVAYGAQLRLSYELRNKNSQVVSLVALGSSLYRRNELIDFAKKYFAEALEVCRQSDPSPSLQEMLRLQGSRCIKLAEGLVTRRKNDDALIAYRMAEDVSRQTETWRAVIVCMIGQALLYKGMQEYPTAIRILTTAERMCIQHGIDDGLITSRGALGAMLFETGDLQGALECFNKEATVSRRLADTQALANSLMNQGIIHGTFLGEFSVALALLAEAKEIAVQHGLDELQSQINEVQRDIELRMYHPQ